MLVVIESGGKQYLVSAGDIIKIEKIQGEKGASVFFEKVLLKANNANVEIGEPYLKNGKVEAEVLHQGKGDKKIVFRYQSKTRYRKKKGHRQLFTEVKIIKTE